MNASFDKNLTITLNNLNDTSPSYTQTLSNITKKLNFSDFNITLNGISDDEKEDLNITVDMNDTSIFNLTQNWENNLTYANYNAKDLNLTISPITDKMGIVELNVTINDGIVKIGKEFNITINPNYAPTDINLTNYSIAENSAIGTKIGDLNATDGNIDDNLTFSFCGGVDNNFTILGRELKTAISLDYESINSYVTCIRVNDEMNASFDKNLTINVTDVSETSPTPTPSSSSGGGSSYISPTPVPTTINSTTSNYEVEIPQNIIKETTNNTQTQTIETIETTLSNGLKSQVTMEIPKENTQTNLKATINVSDGTKTSIETEDKVKITLTSDGGFNSKVENSEVKSEVKVNANSEASTKITTQNKVEVELKTPKGAEIKQENSGKVTSKATIEANTGDNKTKPIEVEMSAEVNGNLKTTVNIMSSNGQTQTFSLELPKNISNAIMELIIEATTPLALNSTRKDIFIAVKSEYKTSSSFKIQRKRGLTQDIEIIGTTAWQKFEERQYFNGKKTIKLLLGGAKIVRNGVEEIMNPNIEYEISTQTNTALTPIYANSSLNIQKGWNLIANPTDKDINLDKALITYKYQNNGWIKDSRTLKPNEGVWVKCDNNEPKAISGTPYNPNFTNLGTNWNLIGAGRDINLSELSKFSEIWAYDNKVKSWLKNPNIIPRGYGFWIKRD